MREHNEAVNSLDIMVAARQITADYEPGTVEVGDPARRLGDRLRKLKTTTTPPTASPR